MILNDADMWWGGRMNVGGPHFCEVTSQQNEALRSGWNCLMRPLAACARLFRVIYPRLSVGVATRSP